MNLVYNIPPPPPPKVSFVIDGESLAYRAYHAFTRSDGYIKKTKEGYYSGCFWGFFSWLGNRFLTYAPHQMYVCWGDQRENLKRKQVDVNYKSHKVDQRPLAFNEQLRDIRLALQDMGFNQYYSPGYEGDDTVATIVKREENRGYDKVVVLSNDKDMLQLVSKTTEVIQIVKGNNDADRVYSDRNQIIEKFQIPVELLTDYLILIGDTSDNVSGIKGIGSKTASSLLNTYGKIDSWINNLDSLNITNHVKFILQNNLKEIENNRKLITLNINVPLVEPTIHKENITADALFDIYELTHIRPYHFLPFAP